MFVEAEPRIINDPAACFFYHTVDLPTYGHLPGYWDLRGRFDDYVAGTTVENRTLLDIGTATGFLTFEAEQRGARVTSLDVSSADVVYRLPITDTAFVRDRDAWKAQTNDRLERLKNSYWLCHRDLRSRARCFYGNVYDLDETFGLFDVVLLGQILIHLRDGISAVAAAASVCTDTIIIVEGSFDNDTPIAALSGRATMPELSFAWYQYSHGWYREVLTMLGFPNVKITTGRYRCNDSLHDDEIELATVVGTRR